MNWNDFFKLVVTHAGATFLILLGISMVVGSFRPFSKGCNHEYKEEEK